MMAPRVPLGFDHLDAFVCYLQDIYYTSNNDPIMSFEIRGVNVTGSPTGRNVMQNVRGQSSMIMVSVLALSDESITQMQIHIGINTAVFHKALSRSAHKVSIACILR